MVVGTLGDAVPLEILVAAGADIVTIAGAPGTPTDLADRYVEPMVGERARTQLQRLLDGTYRGLDLVLVAHDHDASLRLYHTLREIRRSEPEAGVPTTRVFDLQHTGTPAAAAWNRARVNELCDQLGVDRGALRDGIVRCNEARRAAAGAARVTDDARRRVLVVGSAHAETGLEEAIWASGGVLVEPPPLLADEDADPVDAVARRYEDPRCAGARGASDSRAAATVEDARAARADVVVALYLEGEDGLRWELPELRAALDEAGMPLVVLDRSPYDLRGVAVDV